MLRRQRAIEIVPGSKPLRWRRYDVPQHLAPETSDALRFCAVEGDLDLLDRRHRSTIEARRWLGRASMVDRWRRSSRSKSPSTAQNLSASLVSGARCWGTSYRRHRRGLLLGTISIARCRLSIRVQRSHALIPQVWARDCSSSAFPKARSSRIGCILTCGSAPGSWVKSAWPHLRPNAHDWSRSARYACDYCLPMATTSRAS